MPKDKNGKPIQIGSVVSIRGKVVHLSEQPKGNNMTIETLEVLPGSSNPAMRSQFSVNALQVEVEETLDANRAPATHAAAAGSTASHDGPTERELLDKEDKAGAAARATLTDDPTKA